MNLLNSVKRFFAAGYDAAEDNRHNTRLAYGRRVGKDEDSMVGIYDRDKLRQKCINLRRNDSLVAGVCERFADNVVGGGIMPQAKTSDSSWNDEAEAFFREWSKVSDLRQRIGMREIQRIVVQNRIIYGDCGFIMTSGGQLQPIESERITTPKELEGKGTIIDGVRIDPKTGITLGYYVFSRDDNGMVDRSSKNYNFIPAKDFIFCAKPNRFDQVRGIPELAPVINSLEYVHDLQKATLEKAKMDAMNAWAVIRETASGPGNFGPRNASTGVDAVSYEFMESGRTHYLRPGEDVKSLASNTPNSTYLPFMEKSIRLIGSALGLPYEFILLDFSTGNYASSRAALLQTYRTFSDWQMWLSNSLLQRVWNWRIAKAVKNKMLPPAPIVNGVSEWYKVEWAFPEFGWVDPQNEAQANLLEYQLCTNTITQMNRKKGRDVEDVMREKGKEFAFAQRIAEEINAENGTNLTWKDLISAQIPGQTSLPADVGDDDNDDAMDTKKTEGSGIDKWLT